MKQTIKQIFIRLPQNKNNPEPSFITTLVEFWSKQATTKLVVDQNLLSDFDSSLQAHCLTKDEFFAHLDLAKSHERFVFLGESFPLSFSLADQLSKESFEGWLSARPSKKLLSGWAGQEPFKFYIERPKQLCDLFPFYQSFIAAKSSLQKNKLEAWLEGRLKPDFKETAHSMQPLTGPVFSWSLEDKSKLQTLAAYCDKQPWPFLFLDRDGVIVEDVGYPHKIADLKIYPEILKVIQLFQANGYGFGIVTNQAGVAKNKFKLADYHRFTDCMQQQLTKADIQVDFIEYCPYHPDGSDQDYSYQSHCRKPSPGMILNASQIHAIDLKRSIMIGDRPSDRLNNLAHHTVFIEGQYKYPLDFTGLLVKDHQELLRWTKTHLNS